MVCKTCHGERGAFDGGFWYKCPSCSLSPATAAGIKKPTINKTKVFDPQQEIKELKERIKKLEDR